MGVFTSPLLWALMLLTCSGATAFTAPLGQSLGLRRITKAVCAQRAWTRCTPVLCSADGGDAAREEMNKRLDDVAAARSQALSDAVTNEQIAKEMASRAALKRIDDLKARARDAPAPNAPPAARKGAMDPSSPGSSFLSSSVESVVAEERANAKVQEALEKTRAEFFQGVDIDPRGFIVPQVGDIVLCPGKWANEDMVALVEQTQFVDARMSWNIDVIELAQVAPQTYGRSFSAWRKPVKRWFDVSEVRPARAEYEEEQDAWLVENAKTFNAATAIVNETARAQGLEEYDALKQKIFVETAVVGVGGSVACGVFDFNYGTSFALGALASLSYIALLARQIEDVGPGKSSSAGLPIFSPRFAAPLALAVGLYFKFSAGASSGQVSSLGIPQVAPAEIAAAVVGFLSYKIPLLYESAKQIQSTMDDTGDALSSGVDQGYKQWQVRVKDNFKDARARESNPATSLNPFTKIRLTVEQQYRAKALEEEKEARLQKEREERGE